MSSRIYTLYAAAVYQYIVSQIFLLEYLLVFFNLVKQVWQFNF